MHFRLDRFAAAFTPIAATPASEPALPSWSISRSNVDVKNLDLRRARQPPDAPAGSATILAPPSQANATQGFDRAHPPLRIFPGVVHERTRRGSLRQSSMSEKDADTGGTTSMPLPTKQDGKFVPEVVPEESAEPDKI